MQPWTPSQIEGLSIGINSGNVHLAVVRRTGTASFQAFDAGTFPETGEGSFNPNFSLVGDFALSSNDAGTIYSNFRLEGNTAVRELIPEDFQPYESTPFDYIYPLMTGDIANGDAYIITVADLGTGQFDVLNLRTDEVRSFDVPVALEWLFISAPINGQLIWRTTDQNLYLTNLNTGDHFALSASGFDVSETFPGITLLMSASPLKVAYTESSESSMTFELIGTVLTMAPYSMALPIDFSYFNSVDVGPEYTVGSVTLEGGSQILVWRGSTGELVTSGPVLPQIYYFPGAARFWGRTDWFSLGLTDNGVDPGYISAMQPDLSVPSLSSMLTDGAGLPGLVYGGGNFIMAGTPDGGLAFTPFWTDYAKTSERAL